MLRPTNAEPVTYRIQVQGALDNSQTARVTGMQIDTQAGEDAPTITTLTGVLPDEAALNHLLDELYARGLPLISIERAEVDQVAPTGEPDPLTSP